MRIILSNNEISIEISDEWFEGKSVSFTATDKKGEQIYGAIMSLEQLVEAVIDVGDKYEKLR